MTLVNRETAVSTMKRYIKDCIKDVGKAADGKFPLLGTSGMMGIGKTALLWHCLHNVVPEAVQELADEKGEQEPTFGAKAVYLTFNGDGSIARDWKNAYVAQGTKSHCHHCDAFGSALLASCGVDISVATKLAFEQSLRLYRQILNMSPHESLILMVDEVGVLDRKWFSQRETIGSTPLLAELMQEMDKSHGKLIFIFSHIRQDVLNKQETLSGRQVLPLSLPALSVNAWALEPQPLAEQLRTAAASNPGIHQLLLSCCGHPRSVFDGITAAVSQSGLLLTSPGEIELINARRTIINVCKFNHLENDDLFQSTVLRWFNVKSPLHSDELARDGSLLTIPNDEACRVVELLHPLVLQWWAERHAHGSALAFHLCKTYESDALLKPFAEKEMEALMHHYEAVLRSALQGSEFALKDFYKSQHVGPDFEDIIVNAQVPCARELVRMVADFTNRRLLRRLLTEGFIVVSRDPTEGGIEYLSPFTTSDGDLIVAAVQCKFVQKISSWKTLNGALSNAMDILKDMGINCFPVVYTTADQAHILPTSMLANGVYFTAGDLFAFIHKLGPLRLNILKPSKALQKDYPWLDSRSFSRTKQPQVLGMAVRKRKNG